MIGNRIGDKRHFKDFCTSFSKKGRSSRVIQDVQVRDGSEVKESKASVINIGAAPCGMMRIGIISMSLVRYFCQNVRYHTELLLHKRTVAIYLVVNKGRGRILFEREFG